MGRGLVLVPGGITILLGCHDVLLLLPQQDEDKHKAPASAPHRTLSLRAGRSWFVNGTLIGRDKSRPYRPDEMRRPGRLLWQSTQGITARRIPHLRCYVW